MVKTFIFLRGVDSEFKRRVVSEIMAVLNPDVNHIRAIRVSIDDAYSSILSRSKDEDHKAADRSCKNLVKRLLVASHEEQYIVVDNESLQPNHWLSYYNLADKVGVINAICWGIDIQDPVNIFTEEKPEKINLQEQNLPMFIGSCCKYQSVQSSEDLQETLEWLREHIN